MNEFTVQLERGGVLEFPTPPFSLPSLDERNLLMNTELPQRFTKQLTYQIQDGSITGLRLNNQFDSLKQIFEQSLQSVTTWLESLLENYASHLRPLRILYHPFEEALRTLPWDEREDVLHLDNVDELLSQGGRLLSVQVNFHPEKDRILVTSDALRSLLMNHSARAGLWEPEATNWAKRAIQSLPRLLRWGQQDAQVESMYRRFLSFVRSDERIQERSVRHVRKMCSNSVWIWMPDGLTHAVLRGQHVIELQFCVNSSGLYCPEESPSALFNQLLQGSSGNRAA